MNNNDIIKEIRLELSCVKLQQEKICTSELLKGEYMELEGKKLAYIYVLKLLEEVKNE